MSENLRQVIVVHRWAEWAPLFLISYFEEYQNDIEYGKSHSSKGLTNSYNGQTLNIKTNYFS